MTEAVTALPVTLALPPGLRVAAVDATQQRVEQELTELAVDLGLPNRPVVRLTEFQPSPGDPLVQLTVAGRRCRYPRTTVPRALAYVDSTPLVKPSRDANEEVDQLTDGAGADPDRLAELLALICRTAVSARPGALLPGSSLQPALDLGVSVGGRDLAELEASAREDPIEPIIDELAASTLDILVEPAYLRDLTLQDDAGGMFPFARDGLFVELGLPLPPLHFVPDRSLRPAGFAFRFQGVRTLPQIGLAPGTILVNETVERLALLGPAIEAEAAPTVSPDTNQLQSVTSSEHKQALEEGTGLTVWDPLGYLVLAFATAVRRNARALMTRAVAENMVEQVDSAFPTLGRAANEHTPAEVVVPVLRELLEDGMSIRNLRRILELLLRYETVPEDRPDVERVAFVRSGLADAIAFKASRGTSTVVVYLLDPKIEEAIIDQPAGVGPEAPDQTLADQLTAAVQLELDYLPPTAQVPNLLTRQEARRPVRALLGSEFPQMTVLSYADIPPHYNIQPVARISLAEGP